MFDHARKLATRSGALASVAASVLVVGLAACGSSSVTTSVTHTVTAAPASSAPAPAPAATSTTAAAPAASSTTAAATGSGSGASSSGALPAYQPSSVVSKAPNSTVLSSADSVDKVGAFYKSALAKGGWKIQSSNSSAYNATFTAVRGTQGVTVSVYPRGSGSGISISTHVQ